MGHGHTAIGADTIAARSSALAALSAHAAPAAALPASAAAARTLVALHNHPF
jgi:hypothetical protein